MTPEQWNALTPGSKIQHIGDSPLDVFELLVKDHKSLWIGLRRREKQNVEVRILQELPTHWNKVSDPDVTTVTP